MKKSLFVFCMLLGFGFIANFAAAQVINSISVTNMTGCVITAQGYALDNNCDNVCRTAIVTILPHASAAVPYVCSSADPFANGHITIVGIADPASGSGVKVGNGCNVNLTGNYKDCEGITRTATFTAPNIVVVQ